jgi:hypothetical protein
MPSTPLRRWAPLLLASIAAAALALPTSAQAEPSELAPKHVLKNIEQAAADGDTASPKGDAGKTKGGAGNGISYHGGPVILGRTNAYVIWYGGWGSSSTQSLVGTFLGAVGGSAYFNINPTYTNGAGVRVSNDVALAGSTSDSYSQGTTLSDAGVQAVVAKAIANGSLPSDTNGVYFVLTSADVSESSGFLTKYCGWHTHGSIGGKDVKYSFVGDASKNLSACAAQTTSSPNGNPAADAMISVIAHELEEAVTDPDLNAWFDSRGYENADKCAWTFGSTYTVANGSIANMNLGGLDFLIQRNWVNASGGYCGLVVK